MSKLNEFKSLLKTFEENIDNIAQKIATKEKREKAVVMNELLNSRDYFIEKLEFFENNETVIEEVINGVVEEIAKLVEK